jgi:hypothetical protein
VHKITLPHTYYSKHAEHRLLSPQHWAQVANQGKGTRCITYHESIVLIWGNDKYKKTVPLSPSNVGVMSTPPGMLSYLHHCQQATCPLISFPATIHQKLPTVTDSEEEPTSDMEDTPSPIPALSDQPTESTKHHHLRMNHALKGRYRTMSDINPEQGHSQRKGRT